MLDIIRRNSQSWLVKLIFAIIIIVFVFLGTTSMNEPSSDVLAIVNDEQIMLRDFRYAFMSEVRKYEAQNPGARLSEDQISAYGREVLNMMIQETALRQQADALGLDASDAELSYAIANSPDFHQDGIFDEQYYRDILEKIGIPVNVFEKSQHDEITLSKLQYYLALAVTPTRENAKVRYNFEHERRVVDYILFPVAEYAKEVEVGSVEIEAYYKANQNRFGVPAMVELEYVVFNPQLFAMAGKPAESELETYYQGNLNRFVEPARYRSRHILIQIPPQSGAEYELTPEYIAARKKVDDIVAELKNGKNFEDLAKKYSDDITSKSQGGDQGWLEHGQAEPAYELAALALNPGSVSEPVRTYNGFHIIKLEAKKEAQQKTFAEAREEVELLVREKNSYSLLAEAQKDIGDALVYNKDITELLEIYPGELKKTGLLSMGIAPDFLQIDAKVLAEVIKTPAGKTHPFPIDTKEGFMVLKVVDYQPERIKNLEEVQPQIVAVLQEQGAHKLSLDAASELARQINENNGQLPASYNKKLKRSEAFQRTGGLPEIGFSPDFNQAVFSAESGKWITPPSISNAGALLSRVVEVIPASEADWNANGQLYMLQHRQIYQYEMLSFYRYALFSNIKVQILNNDPASRIRFSR